MANIAIAQITKEEKLKNISVKEITTERIANVYLLHGDHFSLVTEADKEQQHNIKVNQEGEKISVSTSDRVKEMKLCNIYITIPYNTNDIIINAYQTGSVSNNQSFTINRLELNFSTVGSTNLNIISDKLVYVGNAVSGTTIKGKVNKMNVTLKSATDFNAKNLISQYLNLKTESIVNADFTVENTLTMKCDNSFNLIIDGNPSKIKKQIDAISTIILK